MLNEEPSENTVAATESHVGSSGGLAVVGVGRCAGTSTSR